MRNHLEKQKNAIFTTYKTCEKETQELNRKLETLKQYIEPKTDKKQNQTIITTPNR